ncbi:hypothetical protein AB0O67_30470 [Streptomyces sp. NPDC086077]|uniref:hypothetical protein n=1 Tax=Streptomyces sp. NPDC086077 TaxID=3154862 RepID=UPI00344A6DB3
MITTAGVYVIVGVLRAGTRLAPPVIASTATIPATFVVGRLITLPRRPAAARGT